MSYLLDTSSFLWFVGDDSKLSFGTRDLLENPGIDIYLSLASVWEIAIKARLGRGLELPRPFPAFIDVVLDNYEFIILEIAVLHLKQVAELPLIHRDPFDRLLIAQSIAENLPIITNDRAFDAYEIQRVW